MARHENIKEMDESRDIYIEDIVKEKLEHLNIDYDTLQDRIIKYLIEIETIIHNKKILIEEALTTIKENKINLNIISDTMKISRTTLYNNKELKEYINYSIEQDSESNPYYIIEKLKTCKKEIESQLFDMVDRDIQLEFQNQELISLKKELIKKTEECNRMKERRNIIISENNDLKTEIRRLKEQSNNKKPINVKKIEDYIKN